MNDKYRDSAVRVRVDQLIAKYRVVDGLDCADEIRAIVASEREAERERCAKELAEMKAAWDRADERMREAHAKETAMAVAAAYRRASKDVREFTIQVGGYEEPREITFVVLAKRFEAWADEAEAGRT